MLRTLTFAALAVFGTATATFAETTASEPQTIVITDFGYFPMVTYLNAGDSVVFSNQTDTAREVMAVRELETDTPQWQSGSLSSGGTYTLVINADTVLDFQSSYASETIGSFSFDEPVLQ